MSEQNNAGVRVEYSSNNSGGSWWLADKDWKALADAGWDVEWGGKYFCSGSGSTEPVCPADEELNYRGNRQFLSCPGHARFKSYEEASAGGEDGRFLDAFAQGASKVFPSLRDGIEEWERVVGQDASEEGCNCCGAPHSFSAGNEYVSGDSVVGVLYDEAPKSLREAAKLLAKRR